ncbi:MAG TPA: hypothetical protein VFG04_08540 [Planctomycetaceae bacterium]|nr:hypothetical protein [Planctomycetaceae bacterium]
MWVRHCVSRCTFTREDLRALSRQPAFFLVAALLCLLITFSVKISGSPETLARVEVTPVEGARAKDAKAVQAKPVTLVEPVAQPVAALSDKKPLRTLPFEEIAALNAAKQQASLPAEEPGLKNGVEPDHLKVFRNSWGLNQPDPGNFKPDPVTGAWINDHNEWQIRHSYHLPVDGSEINSIRRKLAKIGDVPFIEQQWWYPRPIEIRERHWKGRVGKLRFVIALQPPQFVRLGSQFRVLRVLGVTRERTGIVEAEAYSTSSPTFSIAMAVKAKPKLFVDGDRSITRGDASQLPVQGPEIDVVRRAVSERSPGDSIRELKWWPPRLDEETGHQTSKLRYEVNHSGDIKTEELVFDYSQKKPMQTRQAVSLFPERDRRTLRLEQVRN